MNLDTPSSKAEILATLSQINSTDFQFWLGFSPAAFVEPLEGGWSASDTVRHLEKSTKPVVTALHLPGLALRATFGMATNPSISYNELVARYQEALKNGGTAGRFSPSEQELPENLQTWQSDVITNCRKALADLSSVLEGWTEKKLDQYQLPHPLI
ncbi:MAG TPA: hypothetical protein PLB18_21155, partial [Acidobacteriota bacterium]|nr:hypothetical protein [Acidobacteriota bacterium]